MSESNVVEMPEYPVHEMFHTFQGEGAFIGQRAFFIRLYGCPVHCPWCDSAGTWHKDFKPPGHIPWIDAHRLAIDAKASGADICVITGGEPAIHNLTVLCSALRAAGLRVHIETSGAFTLQGRFDWITLSPKRWKLPIRQTIQRAHEFKFIIEAPEDIEFYWKLIMDNRENLPSRRTEEMTPVWLHPEWSKREDQAVLGAICAAVTESHQFRAGWQLHKLYHVDWRDKRSQPPVPLGGDPSKGY